MLIDQVNAQVETIVYDGIPGLTHNLENDSLVIIEITINQPAEKSGLLKGDAEQIDDILVFGIRWI